MMIDGKGCAILVIGPLLLIFVAYAVINTVIGWL